MPNLRMRPVVLGALMGVLMLHPITSVIYWWFEFRQVAANGVGPV